MSTLKVNNLTDLGDDAIVTAGALVLSSSDLPAGSVLQVVSATKTDTFQTTTSNQDITGLTVTVTPSSATSKIFVIADVYLVAMTVDGTQRGGFIDLLRNGTAIARGDNAGGTRRGSFIATQATNNLNDLNQHSNSFLDSPATISALTYKLNLSSDGGGGGQGARINRSMNDSHGGYGRTISTLTVMEVAG